MNRLAQRREVRRVEGFILAGERPARVSFATMRLSRLRVVYELSCLYIELKLFAFRPLSGKQKILLRLCGDIEGGKLSCVNLKRFLRS